jgi:molybdopterin molybdotransferase
MAVHPMTPVDAFCDRILAEIQPLPPYDQPLAEAMGLPICEDVVSPMDLPGFTNSAMDGYAVVADDLRGASEESPVSLPVVGEVAAGRASIYAMNSGTAVKIMTGAPVPAGADAVVPVEWTDRGAVTVSITQEPKLGANIRAKGEDVTTGDLILADGSVLGPRQIGLLAGIGRASIRARPRPRVVVLSTGSELRDPGSSLAPDSIYDANSHMLAAAIRSVGAIAYRVGIVPDDPQTFSETLSDQLVRADLVVTSGGVSKGDYDVVKDVLSRVGTVAFGEVAMQPGKPQGFGFIGEDRTPIFTLPGNPVSSYVSFEVFVHPAIRKMMGVTPYRRPPTRAMISGPIRSIPGRQQYLRAVFTPDGKGNHAEPVGGHGSHLLGGLAAANALIVIPTDVEYLEAGSRVDVLVLDRNF